jgi:hypothetical protein
VFVELREGVKLAHDGVYALKCGDQACQRRRNPQDNPRLLILDEVGVAAELEGVAQPLL